jgi:hypothetical protein
MEHMAILIKGVFTEADWAELARTLRSIEQRHPEQTYHLVALDPSVDPLEDGLDILKRTFPYVDHQPAYFGVKKRSG